MINGKGCYSIAGTPAYGWLTIDDEWYYFDAATFTSVDTLNNGYVTFTFEADGKLTSGQWHHSSAGSRYYYGPGYYKGKVNASTWVEIDGKNYCFDKNGYCLKGINFSIDDHTSLYEWHDFGTDGASRGKLDHTGVIRLNGNTYYLVDGQARTGMFYADGAYYFAAFTDCFAAVKNSERYCYFKNNYGLLPVGTYLFGHDGKMVDHDVYNMNGTLYYYVMGKKSQGTGVFTYEGKDYVIEADGKVLFTGTLKDASGQTSKYVDGKYIHVPKNGIVKEGGKLYYYENDVKVQKGLVKDENGDYYYFGRSYYAVSNGTFYFPDDKMNGLLPEGGDFEVGADCKVIIPEPKNGIV
jgi:glucan-binding YG repeat protein